MNRRERLTVVVVASTVALAVLAVGGAPRTAQALVAVATAASIISVTFSKRAFERIPLLVLLFGAAAAWTFVQWLTLPSSLVHALSPTLETLRVDGSVVSGVETSAHLCADPPATLRALTFLLALGGIAFVTTRLAISERGRYALVAIVAGVCGLAAVVTGLHVLFGAKSLYGSYEPLNGQPLIMGPLLNTNHLGCLMAVGAVTSIGLFAYPKQTSFQRTGWAVCGVICLATVVATFSRGALIGFATGAVVTLFTLLAQRLRALGDGSKRRREHFFATTVPVAVLIACGLVVAVYLGASSVMQQLENTSLQEVHTSTSKFAAWRSTIDLIEDAPWTGVGRGAFETTFTRVHPASAISTFSNPENEGLQAIVEWGIPAALVLGLLGAWFLLRALRRWNDGPLAAGALGALVVVLFQSNFDFGMELLGLAVPVTVLAATLGYVPLSEASSRHLSRLRIVRGLLAVVVVIGGALLLTRFTSVVHEDHVDLRGTPSHSEIVRAIETHPQDYFAYALLARERLKAGDPTAIRTLNHALRLHPTHPGLHWMAAQLLVKAKLYSQAELEYAIAIRHSPDPRALLTEITKVLDVPRASRAIPTELRIDTTVSTLTALQHTDIAMLWLERVMTVTDDLRAAEALYALALQTKAYGRAESALRKRCTIIPSKRCMLDLANVLSLQDKHADVIALLADVQTWRGRVDDQLPAWLLLCDSRTKLAQYSDARDCLRRLDVSGLLKPGEPDVLRRVDAIRQLEQGSASVPNNP